MAKRAIKSETSAKQTAALKRTKKVVTPTKKAPTKKVITKKEEVTTLKKAPVKKAPVKKVTTAKPPVKTTAKAKVKKVVVESPMKKVLKKASKVVGIQHKAIDGTAMPSKNARPSRVNKNTVFVKVPYNATSEEFKVVGNRIKNGEVQWAYFAVDGDKSYHYYRVLK